MGGQMRHYIVGKRGHYLLRNGTIYPLGVCHWVQPLGKNKILMCYFQILLFDSKVHILAFQ